MGNVLNKIIKVAILHRELDRHLSHSDFNAIEEVYKELDYIKHNTPLVNLHDEVKQLRESYLSSLDRYVIAYLLNCDINNIPKLDNEIENASEETDAFDSFFIT